MRKRISGEDVRKELEAQLKRLDRSPFQEILADALEHKPTAKDWQDLAKKNPERYTRSVASMAKLSGFVERTESLQITGSVGDLAQTLVLRYGPDKARQMLELHGLPTSLIPDMSVIDSQADELEPDPVSQDSLNSLPDNTSDTPTR